MVNTKNIARTKIALESLALDLRRVALGYHRGSIKMAKRFSEEAIKRKNEVDYALVKPYIRTLLDNMEQELQDEDISKVAEDSLRMSILFQNYTQVLHKAP